MPSWIGPWEIAIVLVLILLIFGPRKLPDLGASLGKSIRGFRKGLKDAEDEVQSTVSEVKEATNVKDTAPTETPVALAEAQKTDGEAQSTTATVQAETPAASAEAPAEEAGADEDQTEKTG